VLNIQQQEKNENKYSNNYKEVIKNMPKRKKVRVDGYLRKVKGKKAKVRVKSHMRKK